MDRTITWGVLAACAGLVACGGGGNNPVVVGPTADDFDSALPFGTTDGVAEDMLLADLNGVSDNLATITFNADQTYTITLPGGPGAVTVSDASIVTGPSDNIDLGTTTRTYSLVVGSADVDVDVHLGEDSLGNDLFILARIEEDVFNSTLSTLSIVAFGDETAPAALPTGDGVAYTGGFISEAYNVASGLSVAEYAGNTAITANFGLGTVDLTFTDTNEGSGVVFQATGLTVTGAQYGGAITSSGGGSGFSGDVIGAFFGASAEATAGTFNAVDASGGPGTDVEIIGGFTGFR